MPVVKIHAPEQLPLRELNEQKFSIWRNQLRVWLASDDTLAPFLATGQYSQWQSEEVNRHRILRLVDPGPDLDLQENATAQQRAALLDKRRRQLDIFISQVASCVHPNHYNTVVRHATSLQWVFDRIKQDYGISQRGINFMNLRLVQYNAETMTPSGFYHQIRSHFISHTARTGDVVEWNGPNQLAQDEQIGPTTEDLILYMAIAGIDPRLPDYIHKHYQLKMTTRQRLMDVREDILLNIPEFIKEMDGQQLSSITVRNQTMDAALNTIQTSARNITLAPSQDISQPSSNVRALVPYPGQGSQSAQPSSLEYDAALNTVATQLPESTVSQLAAFARARGRGRGFPQPAKRPFCRTCYDADKGKSVYLSHNITDARCPIRVQLSAMEDVPQEVTSAELADLLAIEQVGHKQQDHKQHNLTGLRAIRPVPAQLLSVVDSNGRPLHIELDSAATTSFLTTEEAKSRQFKIKPNKQVSQLGDGTTSIAAVGEIDECLYRNEHKLKYRALVTDRLHCPAIGGTTFILDNDIKQDFVKNQISLLGNKCSVPAT